MPSRRSIAALLVAGLGLAACAGDGPDTAPDTTPVVDTTVPDEAAPGSTPASTQPPSTEPAATTAPTTEPAARAAWTVRPGSEQVAVLDAPAGTELTLVGSDGGDGGDGVDGDRAGDPRTGTVDEMGSLLFRDVEPGDYRIESETETSDTVRVVGVDDVPPASFYADQVLPTDGFGYLTTRDGTTLSINVILPGPPEDGPYPTVVEYSGYQPSDPAQVGFNQLFVALGYAYVGVNMRGSGCSGGSYEFFEPAQSLDGYDAVEAIAAQPWVQSHRVGMVGISYPGISQLFVAATNPPSLAAITPLSVIDDSALAVLYPGGILNTGFGVEWTQQRMDESRPEGQRWTVDRIAAGDTECAANQALRLQNPDLVAMIRDHPFWTDEIAAPIAPRLFVDQIDVPVFLAGAWQDEQTGGHFANMLDRFTGTDHFYASLVNGLHTESLSAGILPRYLEFLDLYVGERVPSLEAARGLVPILASSLFGTDQVTLPPDRFTGSSYEQARATFEGEAPIQVLFEEGAADGALPGTPMPRFAESFDTWPPATAAARSWYLGPSDVLADAPADDGGGSTTYTADPTALPPTFAPDGGSVWAYDVQWQWQTPPPGTAAAFLSAPLETDTVIAGNGSVDLWIRSSTPDTDLEVTISEVRPDGQEVYVQSGWLRASKRALDEAASTELHPVHTFREADAADLPDGSWEPVRVQLLPFAHAFRAGSQLRLTVDAPGNSRAEWVFDTIAEGEIVEVAHDAEHPSRVVLPVVPGIDVPDAAPTCSLRGQPCRPVDG